VSQGSGFTVFNHLGIESVYGVFFCSGAFAGLNSWGRTFQTEAQLQARELFKVYGDLGFVKRTVCYMILEFLRILSTFKLIQISICWRHPSLQCQKALN